MIHGIWNWYSSSYQNSCDSSAGSLWLPMGVLLCVNIQSGCLPPQLPKSVRSNQEDPWKTFWFQLMWTGSSSLFVSILILCVAVAFLQLGFWVFCIQMIKVSRSPYRFKSIICFRMQRWSAANTLGMVKRIHALSTLIYFACRSHLSFLKPQDSESIIQKCQGTHKGWWFIKFSECIPYVTDLLERVRAVIWSKDLVCPAESWLQ